MKIKAQSAVVSTLVALVTAVITWWLVSDPARRRSLLASSGGAQRWLLGGMGLDALVNEVVVRPVIDIADFAQGAQPPRPDERGIAVALAPLRHANLHRYVAGLALGALLLALYLVRVV